ncbi:MAG: hypothetical protein A2735_00380 [Candidatus Yanofskybacteria bacterium RIFCSPHIGHO2_01_FULL_41_21]|uniref:Single cache domain-containing protein n=1 Tax=Candidatus Yanofskybacteria bacterium RIFCSPHIGHO2_01_FULL_41_21 TaxID=1802660 RepID=A0A1F8EBN4_9BACT|nr:MAG: hypothetical protein A2735_00380 [Candidatus Yanofskybacteria bacterium RIFCSPHIGHO2_01_FULL_41_21]
MKLSMPHIPKLFIPLAFVMAMSMGLVYVVVQQNFRANANDPQIQLVEDLVEQLSAGRTVESINTSAGVDMAQSLSLFLFIYDETGKMVVGTGKLDGQYPTLPDGVLERAKEVGENRITWEPQSGLRFALVIIPFSGDQSGFVAIGRSLREVEQRIDMLGLQVLVVWLIGLLGLFILMVGGKIIFSRYFSSKQIV